MVKSALKAIVCGFLMTATAAHATVTFSLTGSSALDGTDGNSRIFVGSDGTTSVRVTGWSILNNTIYDSYLGAYGGGLGVTSGDDGSGANNTHTIDNQTRRDFILLQFNTPVAFNSGVFTTFSVLGNPRDSDATIDFGTTALNWMTQPALNGASLGTLNALFAGGYTSLGDGTGGLRAFPSTGAGNLWLVGADFVNRDGDIDGFKFSTLSVTPVPEPSTWAMMIGGFGLIGGALRYRRKQTTAVLA